MPEWIGKTIGRVRIDKYLARGGMAEVYLGSHLSLDRLVAVKVLHSYIEEDPGLLTRFQRLSPAPELYSDLIDHARQGKPLSPAPFPPHGLAILQQLLLWKIALLAEPVAVAALFQLHVLEVATLEVSAHRVFCDPECPACSGKR